MLRARFREIFPEQFTTDTLLTLTDTQTISPEARQLLEWAEAQLTNGNEQEQQDALDILIEQYETYKDEISPRKIFVVLQNQPPDIILSLLDYISQTFTNHEVSGQKLLISVIDQFSRHPNPDIQEKAQLTLHVLSESESISLDGLRQIEDDDRTNRLPLSSLTIREEELKTLNQDQVRLYRKKIQFGERIDPIRVLRMTNGIIEIDDGMHRYLATKEEGLEDIEVVWIGEDELPFDEQLLGKTRLGPGAESIWEPIYTLLEDEQESGAVRQYYENVAVALLGDEGLSPPDLRTRIKEIESRQRDVYNLMVPFEGRVLEVQVKPKKLGIDVQKTGRSIDEDKLSIEPIQIS